MHELIWSALVHKPSGYSAGLHRAPAWGVLFALGLVLAALPASSADPPPVPPATTVDPPEAPLGAASATERAEELYRKLFEASSALSRSEGQSGRDSLQAEIDLLEDEIKRLRSELRQSRESAPQTPLQEDEWRDLESEIMDAASRGDFDGFNEQLTELLSGLDDMGVDLGEKLGEVQLEISAERFRLATEGGGYIDIAIPEEVRQNLREGVKVFNAELGRVLSDSMLQELGRDLEEYAEGGEGAVALLHRLRPEPKRRKWKVIGSSVFKAGTSYRVAEDELVKGDVVVMGGRLQIEGKVLGKAVSVAGDLEVAESGVVEGDAISFGGNVVSEEGATIGGRVIDFGQLLPGAEGVRGATPYLNIVMLALRLAVMVVLAIILLALMGDRLDAMCGSCEAGIGRPFGMGMLWLVIALFLFTLSAFTLALTIIGIPVVILLGVVFGSLLLAAYFVTCRLLGRRILGVLGVSNEGPTWQSILLGLVVLEAPAILLVALALVIAPDGSAMAIPRTVDLVLKFLALSLGFGCVINSRFGAPSAAPRAQPASATAS